MYLLFNWIIVVELIKLLSFVWLDKITKWVAIKKLKTPCRGVGGWVKVPFLTTWILKIWEIYKYKSAKIGISGNFADFNRYFVNFERFLRYGWYGHIKYVSKMGWVGGSKCHSWPHGKWTTWCARFFYCHPLGKSILLYYFFFWCIWFFFN